MQGTQNENQVLKVYGRRMSMGPGGHSDNGGNQCGFMLKAQ